MASLIQTRNGCICDVETDRPDPLDTGEPDNVAEAVETTRLKHAVITRTLIVGIQHPGGKRESHVPGGGAVGRRPSILSITRNDGDVIG